MSSNKELLKVIKTAVNYLNNNTKFHIIEPDSALHRQMIDVLKAHKKEESDKYFWGQRVIVDNQTIAIFRHYEDNRLWVELPDGVIQWRDSENVKPLPGGQL